jgi:hypothetical protein
LLISIGAEITLTLAVGSAERLGLVSKFAAPSNAVVRGVLVNCGAMPGPNEFPPTMLPQAVKKRDAQKAVARTIHRGRKIPYKDCRSPIFV